MGRDLEWDRWVEAYELEHSDSPDDDELDDENLVASSYAPEGQSASIPVHPADFERGLSVFLIQPLVDTGVDTGQEPLEDNNTHRAYEALNGRAALAPPILVQGPNGPDTLCPTAPSRCHSSACATHRIAQLARRLDQLADVVAAAPFGFLLRLPLPDDYEFPLINLEMKRLRRTLLPVLPNLEFAWVTEPNEHTAGQHVHVVGFADRDLLAALGPLSRQQDPDHNHDTVAAIVAKAWRLTPPGLDLSNPILVRRCVWFDSLPGTRKVDADGNLRDFSWQTPKIAARYALDYLVKRWRDPSTYDDHISRNGGKAIRFSAKWPTTR